MSTIDADLRTKIKAPRSFYLIRGLTENTTQNRAGITENATQNRAGITETDVLPNKGVTESFSEGQQKGVTESK